MSTPANPERLLTRADVENAKELFAGREITISALATVERMAAALRQIKLASADIDSRSADTEGNCTAACGCSNCIASTLLRKYEGGSDV